MEDLEQKVAELERELEMKVCRKCKAALSDGSSTEEERFNDSMMPLVEEPENDGISFLNVGV